jgi:histone H3/H4
MIGKKIPSSVVSLTSLTPLGKFMQLPLNKVRAIINLDDESSVYSKEALVLITKATEMFVNDLSGVCAQIAKLQKRKTLQI